jgi:hypothetical protein
MRKKISILEKIIRAQRLITSIIYTAYGVLIIVAPLLLIVLSLMVGDSVLSKAYSALLIHFSSKSELNFAIALSAIFAVLCLIPLRYSNLFFTYLSEMADTFKRRDRNYESQALFSLQKANRALLVCVLFSYGMAVADLCISASGLLDRFLEKKPPKANNFEWFSTGYDFLIPNFSGFTGLILFVVMSYACHLWKEKIRIDAELLLVSEEMTLTI